MPASRLKPSICIDSITSNKNINRNTACSELFESGDLEFACENCKSEVDISSHSRKITNMKNILIENEHPDPKSDPLDKSPFFPNY